MEIKTTGSATPKDKRALILQAAWDLIRHYGYHKTTIGDIAKHAGVGKGTIYLYFDSKTDIMLALADLTNERIIAELEQIANSAAPPKKRLRECLLHRVMTLYDLMQRYPHSQDVIASMMPEIVERLDRYVHRHGKLLDRILKEGLATGDFKLQDMAGKGQMLADLFEFFTPPYYRFRSRKSLLRFADRVFDILLSGL